MKTTDQHTSWLALLACAVLLLAGLPRLNAQGVAIGTVNAPPEPSAILDVQSTTGGMLIPRMTAPQRLAIVNPANALIVYQTANFSTPQGVLRRGFWYFDANVNEWIHLGKEYTGIIQQPVTVEESSHLVFASAPGGVGVTQLNWIPPFLNAPSVVATAVYEVEPEPPAIGDYCQPEIGNCNGARMWWMAFFVPESAFGACNPCTDPPLGAKIVHGGSGATACTGAANVNYRYIPNGTGPNPNDPPDYNLTTTPEMNYLSIDYNFGAGDDGFGLWANGPNGSGTIPKSFSFFVDLNADGDFDDPGEMVAIYDQLAQTTTNRWFFSSINAGWNPPITIADIADASEGITKMRIIIRSGQPPTTNPCFEPDANTTIYDMDIEILGTGNQPVYPSDLNQCNVDEVAPNFARVSCFNNFGQPTDVKFHYKVISHD
ncbi:MAG: hypothetical protein EA392_10520 [Cryomorphaceae bacterium]|nr:MAG: hypothetical protein EA392_10520 [Cryomorphaceae bacterium]